MLENVHHCVRVEQVEAEREKAKRLADLPLHPGVKGLLECIDRADRRMHICGAQRPVAELLEHDCLHRHVGAPPDGGLAWHVSGEPGQRQNRIGRSMSGSGSAWRLPCPAGSRIDWSINA